MQRKGRKMAEKGGMILFSKFTKLRGTAVARSPHYKTTLARYRVPSRKKKTTTSFCNGNNVAFGTNEIIEAI